MNIPILSWLLRSNLHRRLQRPQPPSYTPPTSTDHMATHLMLMNQSMLISNLTDSASTPDLNTPDCASDAGSYSDAGGCDCGVGSAD